MRCEQRLVCATVCLVSGAIMHIQNKQINGLHGPSQRATRTGILAVLVARTLSPFSPGSNHSVVVTLLRFAPESGVSLLSGTVGGTNATPMLNPPEVSIVALGRVQALPRYDASGEVLVKKHIMSVSWGGDHRVVDGAAIAEFSNYWKHLLEEPARLLMHMR